MAIDAEDARRTLNEIKRQAANAAEYSDNRRQVSRNFCERSGVAASTLSKAVSLDRMDVQKRSGFYRELLGLGLALGHFDQIDAFDDLRELASKIASAEAPTAADAASPEASDGLDGLTDGEAAEVGATDNGASKLHDLGEVRQRKRGASGAKGSDTPAPKRSRAGQPVH